MSQATTAAPPTSKGLHVSLWIGQVLLAGMFTLAGLGKLTSAAEFPYPAALTNFIGTAELLGAAGVILPSLLRIKPGLTSLAAAGLATIMALAIGYHVTLGEGFAMNVVLGAIAAFVAWGRTKKARIEAR